MPDTRTCIGPGVLDPDNLPDVPEITAVTPDELHQGVPMAKDPASRAARTETPVASVADFEALPFDADAAARYGTLVTLTIAAGRDPDRAGSTS